MKQLILKRIGEHLNNRRLRFVFPTEVAAESWARAAVRSGAVKAVRLDQFISWDICRRELLPPEKGLTAVTSAARHLFTVDFLRKNSKEPQLTRIIRQDSAAHSSRYHATLTAILPTLTDEYLFGEESGSSLFPPDLYHDLMTIRISYAEFLQNLGMYEPLWEKLQLTDAAYGEPEQLRYMVLFPELIPELGECREDRFVSLSGASAQLLLAASPKMEPAEAAPRLHLFSHVGEEISSLFSSIGTLLQQGIDPSEITITSADYYAWKSELNALAELHGFPFSFRSGSCAAEHPAGRLFRTVSAVIAGDFSLESMKALLLNCSFPWKDRGAGEKLIRFALSHQLRRNFTERGRPVDVWEQKLLKAGEQELLSYYKRLSAHLKGICAADSLEMSYERFMRFWNGMFDPLEWSDQPFISFCLESFRELITVSKRAGMDNIAAAYDCWLSYLDKVHYNPQQPQLGISCYPYGVSAGMAAQYHFVLGLNEKNTAHSIYPFPFLLEQERETLAVEELDLSDALLCSYLSTGDEVLCSCSRRDYEGAQLPAGWFVEHELTAEGNSRYEEDPVVTEEELWLSGRISQTPLPALSVSLLSGGISMFETGLAAKGHDFISESIPEAGFVEAVLPYLPGAKEGRLQLSPTAIDTFVHCPADWLFSRTLQLESEQFTPKSLDPRVVGNIIHECFREIYLPLEQGARSLYTEELRELYRSRLSEGIKRSMNRLVRSSESPVAAVVFGLQTFLEAHLFALIDADIALFPQWETFYLEEKLSKEMGNGYLLEGRVDRVSAHETDLAIVDYKKRSRGSAKSFSRESEVPFSYQLPLYSFLLREQYPALEVKAAHYYDVTEMNYKKIYPARGVDDEAFARMADLAAEAADVMAQRLRDGNYQTVPSREQCGSCRQRSICRGRFSVR